MILPAPVSGGDATALVLAILAIELAFMLVMFVVAYLLMALSLSSLFAEVGVEPWIAWIPVYSYWKWLELGGQRGWISLLVLIPYGGLVTSVFLYIGMYRTGLAFRRGGGFLVLGIFFPFVWAWILGSSSEVYQPELIAHAGFGPPLVGYGAAAPYVPQQPSPYTAT